MILVLIQQQPSRAASGGTARGLPEAAAPRAGLVAPQEPPLKNLSLEPVPRTCPCSASYRNGAQRVPVRVPSEVREQRGAACQAKPRHRAAVLPQDGCSPGGVGGGGRGRHVCGRARGRHGAGRPRVLCWLALRVQALCSLLSTPQPASQRAVSLLVVVGGGGGGGGGGSPTVVGSRPRRMYCHTPMRCSSALLLTILKATCGDGGERG